MGETLLLGPRVDAAAVDTRQLRELAQQRDVGVSWADRERLKNVGYLVANERPYALTDTGRVFLKGDIDATE